MKLGLAVVAIALAVPASAAQPAAPPSTTAGHYGTYGIAPGEKLTKRVSPYDVWRIRVLALRREALNLQQQDGGTLRPEHRAALQAKLDRINAQAQQP